MKPFFTIELLHEYDQGTANNLSIVPAVSSKNFISKNRLWLRSQGGYVDCFIEEDDSLKHEIDILYFWVVCTNEAFYGYTEYPVDINFSKPHFYWHNLEGSTSELQSTTLEDYIDKKKVEDERIVSIEKLTGLPPKNTIGCIGITLNELTADEKSVIKFSVKKTIWEYHIVPKESHSSWVYSIEEKNKKWLFEEHTESGVDKKMYRSTEPIPYFKKASNRLKLVWHPKEGTKFQEEQEMILPFASYAYKVVTKDNIELTPVYIHI